MSVFRPEPAPRLRDYAGDVTAWADALAEHINATLAQLENLSQSRDTPSRLPYIISGVTASRSFNAGAATLAETRQVLGTLLEDLVTKRTLRTKGS